MSSTISRKRAYSEFQLFDEDTQQDDQPITIQSSNHPTIDPLGSPKTDVRTGSPVPSPSSLPHLGRHTFVSIEDGVWLIEVRPGHWRRLYSEASTPRRYDLRSSRSLRPERDLVLPVMKSSSVIQRQTSRKRRKLSNEVVLIGGSPLDVGGKSHCGDPSQIHHKQADTEVTSSDSSARRSAHKRCKSTPRRQSRAGKLATEKRKPTETASATSKEPGRSKHRKSQSRTSQRGTEDQDPPEVPLSRAEPKTSTSRVQRSVVKVKQRQGGRASAEMEDSKVAQPLRRSVRRRSV